MREGRTYRSRDAPEYIRKLVHGELLLLEVILLQPWSREIEESVEDLRIRNETSVGPTSTSSFARGLPANAFFRITQFRIDHHA